ncbi:SwmB domain-containing protein [Cohnella herbarum]|uniref:SLH domain-containing protein n=1 Tax=Cohnella herbarum TaxID=2728023 RepID=A0A7Z2VLQ1_9BACL|nr:SwmB domain-containing protein [Cohnella herbarum]QJD85244.1 hypothetical protein HH215_20080 [Cohnella herbarum]
MQLKRTLSLLLFISLIVQSLSITVATAAPVKSEVHALAGETSFEPSGFFPIKGATSVVPNTILKLTFNEAIILGTGNIVLTNVGGTAFSESYAITDTSVVQLDTVSTSIIIKPRNPLPAGTYQVTVPSTAVISYGTPTKAFVGIDGITKQWTFQVEDLLVTYLFPAIASQTVDPVNQANLSMSFNREVSAGSGYIQVKRASDNVTVYTSEIKPEYITGLTVNVPISGLDYNTIYHILIDSGVLRDKVNGGAYAGFSAGLWSFKTKPALDTIKPKAVSYAPVNNGTVGDLKLAYLSMQFDERVFANENKSLVITNAANGSLVCTIPANLTVDPVDGSKINANLKGASCPDLVNNTNYTVTIGPDVYRDASGNYFEGVSWKFKALVDTIPPAISAYAPMVSSTNVSISTTVLSLTFNEPLGALLGTAKAYIFPQNSPSSRRELTMTLDSANNKVLFSLTGSGTLSNSTQYSISVPENTIQDTTGNKFAGISNPLQWTFQTGTNSMPVINSSSIDGANIVLTYNENLDSNKVPAASNFYVTVNDVVTPVTGVTIYNSEVRISLQYNVLIGQTVKVSYFQDANIPGRRLQNISGVAAESFSNRIVTNMTDSTLPKPVSGTIYGDTLTLTFNRSIPLLPTGAQSQFTVKQNGSTIGIKSAVVYGTTLNLTFSSNSTSPMPVSITYTPGANPLRDQSGNLVPAFTDFYVRNVHDNAPPTLSSATLNGNKIVLNYNEGLNTTSVPPKNSFSIVASGTNTALPTITNVAVINNTIELTLSSSVAANIPLLLYYYPTSPAIIDLSSNAAPAIVGFSFTTGSSAVAQLSTLNATNNQIALTYSSTLSATSIPYITQYGAKFDGVAVPVTAVSVSGTQVILTLSTAVRVGQRVTLSYNVSGVPLKDSLSQSVVAFTDLTVTNNGGSGTPLPGNLPEYLESDGAGGVRFIVDKVSTAVSAATPSGRTANRYMINGDKLLASFDAIKQGSGITVPMITFKVPTTEAGALVGIPLRAIMDATSKASNASFRLDYGDVQFTIPLKAINYNKQLQSTGGDVSTAYILLNIEKVQNTPLASSLAGRGAQLLATPANFSASMLAGGREREIDGYETYVTRTFVLSSTGGTGNGDISVVRIDNDSGDVTYVPTNIQNATGGVNVNFKRKGNSTYAVIRNNAVFTDMTKHWARDDVAILGSKFIVRGPTLTTFSPGREITRSEFAEYIARGLGLNGATASAAKFKDVGTTFKTASYIGAVSDAGIVEGDTSGRFKPNAPITREEMATILVRAMKYAEVQTTPNSSALNEFKDKAKVSSWAKDGMATSVTAGFIKGSTTKTINPQSNATRAEAAIMIKRFLEYVDFL